MTHHIKHISCRPGIAATSAEAEPVRRSRLHCARLVSIGLAAIWLVLVLGVSSASASKEVVAYFGTAAGTGSLGGEFNEISDIAVNSSGAGPADAGEVYVIERANHRIQRFALDLNGTPGNTYDDTYTFVSAWGAGVLSGGTDYEICTAAASCNAGKPIGGNGTLAGDGSLKEPGGISVDEDNGNVYVSDSNNFRINVYSGSGEFLRSFGYDVIGSGPGDEGSGYEVCVVDDGDVCKAGVGGSGVGQVGVVGFNGQGSERITLSQPDGNPSSGTVFLADNANSRVGTYGLDGSSPSFFGTSAEFGNSGPKHVAVDSRGIVYAEANSGGALASQVIARYDSQNANGGGAAFLAPIPIPPLLSGGGEQVSAGLAVDPDADGAGPDADVLYAFRGAPNAIGHAQIQQFGPLNQPGLAAPPSAVDDTHGTVANFISSVRGIGLDTTSGRLFVSSSASVNDEPPKSGVYVLDPAGGVPSASLDSVSDVTESSATLNATVNPNGGPPVSYQAEYSSNGVDWSAMPKILIGTQETPQQLAISINPPGGLNPGTFYHLRLAVSKAFTPALTTSELTFTTLAGAPQAETVGSPVRTATTARLEGRVGPRNSASTFHFEYGDQGPCDANPCTSTPTVGAGSGSLIQLVSQEIAGLQSATTYHYRLVVESSAPGSPSLGADMTVTTRASDAPLAHGRFPGPPGSDRAYEQVSAPDTSGNPIVVGRGYSDDGNRAVYMPAGGVPGSSTGSLLGLAFAERPSGQHPKTGWQFKAIQPPRGELSGERWIAPTASDDLGSVLAVNVDAAEGGSIQPTPLFQMSPGGAATNLYTPPASTPIIAIAISEDGSRTVAVIEGSHDPLHPTSGRQAYDVTDGSPSLISILPGGATSASCGAVIRTPGVTLPSNAARHADHWVSADGSLVFFECEGLYVRNLEAQATTQIAKQATFIKSTPGAAFFSTSASLDPKDSGGTDVYRYDLATEARECVSCVVDGFTADPTGIAVSEDGSRVYFKSSHVLLAGAAANGIYRVDVASGELAYVATIGEANVGDVRSSTQAMNEDGSAIVFRSNDSSLNPLGDGSDNGGSFQYYRYDDSDRSLLCVSCPVDGSPPLTAVSDRLGELGLAGEAGPNLSSVSADGTVAFTTTTPLVGADQNTPGPGGEPLRGSDVYEWRDGRILLVTDGLTNWTDVGPPTVSGISSSGRDLFFLSSGQLTPDTLEASIRLYDARIGGGMDIPSPPKPCPLEVCQGIPKGAPEERAPGTGVFVGPGNATKPPAARRCPKGKRRVRRGGKARCVKRNANHDRRSTR